MASITTTTASTTTTTTASTGALAAVIFKEPSVSKNGFVATTDRPRVPETKMPTSSDSTKMQTCPVCTKSFKNLKQHDTKMHQGGTIYFDAKQCAFLVIGDTVHRGDMPYDCDDGDEWEFYPDGSDGTQTVTLMVYHDGTHKVFNRDRGERKYIHNIRVAKTPYNPFD